MIKYKKNRWTKLIMSKIYNINWKYFLEEQQIKQPKKWIENNKRVINSGNMKKCKFMCANKLIKPIKNHLKRLKVYLY